MVEKNIKKALDKFIIAYKTSESKSYKRFCYFYIYRVRKILYEQNNVNIIKFINENEIKDTEKTLFNFYYNAIKSNINNLSSSYFYYLSRLLNKKIGNNGDKILEFICIQRASEYRNDSPGSGSIISTYRKYKSINLKNKSENEYKEEMKKIQIKDSEGYGEDGTICPICFENKRNKIALPCKHLFCEICLDLLKKCPICRTPILLKYSIS